MTVGGMADERTVELRALVENLDDLVLLADRSGRAVLYSRSYAAAVQRLFGVEARPGEEPHARFPNPMERERWGGWARRALAGERFTTEIELGDRSGERRWLEISFSPIREHGEVIGYTELAHDVTAQRRAARSVQEAHDRLAAEVAARERAERELRESESRFRALTERSADITVILGPGGCLTYVSPSVRAFGYKAEEIIGLTLAELVHPDDWGWVEEVLGEAAARPGLTRRLADFRVRHRNGAYFELEGRVTNLAGVPGVNGTVFNGRDVTERKMLEARVRQAEKMDAIGSLAGGIAHDFNNQLSGIMGNADLLAGMLEDEAMRTCALDIVRATRRASDLTRQLLTFGRREPLQRVTVDLHRTIAEVVSLLERSLPKNIAIERDLRAAPATTLGDPSGLLHAFLNLAVNARDALPEGGTLTFSTDIVAIDDISLRHFEYDASPGQYVMVALADTGVGMDDTTRTHMFEPFFTTKERGKGTGMGLASVFGTVISHGGTLAVSSALGRGTRVDVFLPLEEELQAVETDGFIDVVPMAKARLMVVDDEQTVRVVLERMLQRLGHDVAAFASGAEAVEYYRSAWSEVDAVILDIVMPGLGGGEVFDALAEINPDVQVVLASGFTVDGEAAEILRRGAREFIQKPFRLTALSDALRGVLPGGRLRRLRAKVKG